MVSRARALSSLFSPSKDVGGEIQIGGGPAADPIPDINSLPLTGNSIGDQAFVTSTNRLYIWNGSGWYNIALINTNPSFDSAYTPLSLYNLELNDSGYIPPLSITLLATDPEGIPITYSAILSDSASYFANVTQNDNIFTITPKSVDSIGEYDSSGGTFTITFRASDGVNLATALSEFTIDLITIIENSRYTTLLAASVGPNNGVNNVFTDASPNAHTITTSGDTHAGTFSPYSRSEGAWSNYFDGTGDYLSAPSNAAFTFGTGDFTVEFWVYLTGNTSNFTKFFATGSASSCFTIETQTTTNLLAVTDFAATVFFTSSSALSLNTWTHIAVSRNGTSLKLFQNGIQTGSSTNSTNFSGSIVNIGGNGTTHINGYISNCRVVKGTALYTSNFTPPTSPLIAIGSTSLLTCQSNRFKDNSTNNFTLTLNGNVSVRPFGPYDYEGYDTAINGGSAYLDATGDYLSTPSTTAFALGTQDFCIETWYYPVSKVDAYPRIVHSGAATWATSDNWALLDRHNDASTKFSWACYNLGVNSLLLQSSTVVQNNTWYHLAVTRSGNTFRLFVNGVIKATYTNSGSCTTSSTVLLRVGGNTVSDAEINGYISNLRFVKGSAVYTANFTPPTEPLTAISNTSLLLNTTDASIVDLSGSSNLKLAGNARSSTTTSKYRTSSMYFDGIGDGFTAPSSPIFDFGTGNFTIETWIRFADVSSTWEAIISRAYKVAGGWRLYKADGNSGLIWYQNTTSVLSVTSGIVNNVWYHVAVVRNNGTLTIYVDGVSKGSASDTTSYNPGTYDLEIGRGIVTSEYPFEGYMEDVRITKGLARYTSNFTPPTSPLLG